MFFTINSSQDGAAGFIFWNPEDLKVQGTDAGDCNATDPYLRDGSMTFRFSQADRVLEQTNGPLPRWNHEPVGML